LYETTIYVKHCVNDVLIVSLYIDNLLLTKNNTRLVHEFKTEKMKVFEMTDLGLMSFFLEMKIKQIEYKIFICQKKYVKKILKKFKFEKCKETSSLVNQEEKLCKKVGTDKIDDDRSLDLLFGLIVTLYCC